MASFNSTLCCIKSLLIFCLISFFANCKKEIKLESSGSASANHALKSNLNKPNILFIVGDDIGYEIPTCNEGRSYSTPNLDAMATNGMRFTECHALPLCAPSRISLLTGKYNFRNYTGWGYLSTDQKTLANMLGDAGYATCYTGKWQLDGGDASIRTFGWQRYSVWLPFLLSSENLEGSRYKSAKIYQGGGYMPAAYSLNKYSDDLFTSYLLNFIDSMQNESIPFFAYYAMILAHGPFCPTPDDPQYTTWDYVDQKSDSKYFPSMIKYMDKKIGEIITHLRDKGILDNTIIFYIGDNGTPPEITSLYGNNIKVPGGKGEATEIGTNVPLLVQCSSKIAAGAVSNTLVDLPDFLPTLADVAGIPEPTTYGTLDGVSFYPALQKSSTLINPNTFSSYCVNPSEYPWRRWVQNDSYKLFDTNINNAKYKFFKVTKCKPDSLLNTNSLTPEQKKIRSNFIDVLRSVH